jgi:hypothetical protein
MTIKEVLNSPKAITVLLILLISLVVQYKMDADREAAEQQKKAEQLINEQKIKEQQEIYRKSHVLENSFGLKCGDDYYIIGDKDKNLILLKWTHRNQNVKSISNFLINDDEYFIQTFEHRVDDVLTRYVINRKTLQLTVSFNVNGTDMLGKDKHQCGTLEGLELNEKTQELMDESLNLQKKEHEEKTRLQKIKDYYNSAPKRI